jgi:hypothetical protein
LPPRGLAPPLHRLPPILDNAPQTPTSSCSKGSRGLSVQPRVLGIFTETTVSPDPSLRQRPSRYAIRAGRNFALILRFRRRRLSLHPGADSRESLRRRTVAFRSDSSPVRARRFGQGPPSRDALPLPSIGRRLRITRNRVSFRRATDKPRSEERHARGDPRAAASPTSESYRCGPV